MKKLQFTAWPKLCSLLLLGAATLFMVSCADDELSGDTFVGTYSGSQLAKPDESSITITASSDRTTQTVSWKTVDGALSYVINVRAGSTKDNYDEVVVKDQLVRGNSFSFARESKKYYRVSLTTAYNPAEGNTASDPNDPAVKEWDTFSTDITLPAGTDLAAYFKENDPKTLSEGMPLIITLLAEGQYTMSDAIDFSGVNATISGQINDSIPVLTLGENELGGAATFITDSPLTIENINVNFELGADSKGNPLITLSKEPTCEEINNYYRISDITLNNVNIAGLRNGIFYDNNTKYCVVNFTIMNSVIELATKEVKNEAFIAFQGGGAKDFTVKNSTIYGNNEIAKYFVRYENSARIDRYGYSDDDTWSFTYESNTFYGLLKEDGQWGNYSGIAGNNRNKQGVMTITDNIWYNCDAETIRRLLSSTNFSTFNESSKMSNNTCWYKDAAVDSGERGNGTDLKTQPVFVNASEGDFTLGACEQRDKGTGDPRWLK